MPNVDFVELVSRIRAGSRLFIIDEFTRQGIEDVEPSHGAVLAHLFQAGGPVSVTTLVVALKRPKSTITKTTDSLERGGYLRKKPNPADGRSYLVDLTPQGREFFPIYEEILRKLEQKIFQDLSQDDRQNLARLLHMVEHNLD